ncbi:BTB domain-containing protein [Favolaschia claudopus]|uniref:BTB domain-containing protein n=1 Tax=Favolaschia claudopus TaxID=2862362 RepID=A0AAW0BFM3_9AGAR
MSSPPAKRQRTDNTETSRSDLWKTDGSVILQAGNMQFRVHWSVLADNSSVFCDMQGLPQPSDQPTVEGCPIVELSDDPVDVEFLLKALYSPTFLCQEKVPFPAVAALVRLGRKYEFKNLLDAAVARLTAVFPTTIEEYDLLISKPRYSTLELPAPLLFDVIALATENNLWTVLPCAYTDAVKRFKTADFFDGIKDGARTVLLPLAYLRRCIMFQQSLLAKQYQPGYTIGWLRKWDFEADCTNPGACRTLRENFLANHMDKSTLVPLVKWETSERLLTSFCRNCGMHIRDCITSGRKRMWDELPGLLDLPPWGELKNGD